MYRYQRSMTEKLLFDYYLVSSIRENEIYTPFTFYLDKEVYQTMVYSAEVLDGLVTRIIKKYISNPGHTFFETGEFLFKEEILTSDIPLAPFFWARYDTFCREDGGVFFCEFNYDKPCAQREILASCMISPDSSPNKEFKEKFLDTFDKIIKKYFKNKKKLKIAFLVDSCHYEELHLGYLFTDLLKPLGYEFIIADGQNFRVENDKVFAFDTEIDVMLRLYPTEFLYEVNDFENILKLYKEGKFLILNDPRVILGQAKSLFAYLWELVETNDGFISEIEKDVIRNTIPYTTIFKEDCLDDVYANKDKYVIKAVYGRYSEEVYIGAMHSEEEWAETIQYVTTSEKPHIIQEFCQIKRNKVLRFDGYAFNDENAYGNFGIYLMDGKVYGSCIRWSRDYLSSDDEVWITPIGIRDRSIITTDFSLEDRALNWEHIYNKALFQHGYTGGYTGMYQSFALEGIILDKSTYAELVNATNELADIFLKTTQSVQENSPIFCPVLGISDNLSELVKQNITSQLSFIGRFDWVMDTKGNLKLLEYNSETPAGLVESLGLNDIIKHQLGISYQNPNLDMGLRIVDCFKTIVKDYENVRSIRNIGIISTTYYEDWYNTTAVYDLLMHLPYNFILGEVSELTVKEGQCYLKDTPLDAVYRYYPLDWFDQDPYFSGVLEALSHNTLSINPPSTLISQSKAFMALIYELMKQGFYSNSEVDTIKKYIPETSLSHKKLSTWDYCIKPYFGREGQSVRFSCHGLIKPEEQGDFIFQERIDIGPVDMEIYSTIAKTKEVVYPVLGAFVVGNSFAGLYTRGGGKVTDKNAIYIPTYINIKDEY